ncbi:S9 family peptidase [Alteromonas sp. ASW11-36]|uniref:S9 family peptidase n=1 Tax=Alteromonas arenosi TaxID=3055817 RepID=A0ABT7T1U5_9ALTE|nr:S9 family peptidase [Alteromonas sp. ASW11-36]MDM7861764.1 S9 family peptidase [Alteromonas sp. ASW11-36]
MLSRKFSTLLAATAVSTALIGCSPANQTDTTAGEPVATEYTRMQALTAPAPTVEAREASITHHGITVEDPYQWLRDSSYPDTDDPDVIGYLEEENAYYQAFLEPHRGLVDKLFEEFKGRVDENDTSVPFVRNGYEYRWEFKPGNDYRTRIRKNLETGEESVFLDEQALSQGHDYFVLGGWDISPDNNLIVYIVDTSGDERYTGVVKDLTTGEILPIDIQNASRGISFTPDGTGIIYSKLNDERWQTESINLRTLAPADGEEVDRIIFAEDDTQYFLGFAITSDKKWLVKYSNRSGNTEISVLPSDNLAAEPVVLVSKADNASARIDAANDAIFMTINDQHVNSRMVKIPAAEFGPHMADKSTWQTIIEGSDEQYLTGFRTFADHIALQSSVNGLEKIRILDFDANVLDELTFPESVYQASIGFNAEYSQDYLRVNYESMITPDTVFDYHLASKEFETRKVRKIPSGYNSDDYRTERLMAPARDGAMIPISIVYHKSFEKNGQAPMSLYAYGAYGAGMSPSFSSERISLLDRGFSFAIAHVRGGDEMGYQWYLDGKLKKRMNAFNDFVDVANYLIDEQYVSAGNISISGRSAGGKMMGAMTIQAPELWRSVILGVPFVDVLNTMLDASLPLTPPEWQEWGNPIESKEDFELLLSYSPYDNITAREYPPMMVTGGLNDPRVTYWEPAKWTARMRNTKTDNNLLVMRMNMGAGHFANSGRYGRLADRAEEYAFQLLAHGITE